jgi:hypothetical protein
MPDSIEAYYKEIQRALQDSPFVHEPKNFLDDRGEVWFLRGDVAAGVVLVSNCSDMSP